MAEYFKIGELEELERVKKASAAVVRRARDDKEYAHKILEEIGYFRMMSSEPICGDPIKSVIKQRDE